MTSILTCPACRAAFGIGLLAWPIRRGRHGHSIPVDHQPTRRQLRDLAMYAYGIWADEVKKQGDSLNVAIDQECRCPREVGGWRSDCPVHGWDRHLERQQELEAGPPSAPSIPDEEGESEDPGEA